MGQYVYRLQNAAGKGVYSVVCLGDGEHGCYNTEDGFPPPNHDGLGSLGSGSRWIFGFKDLLQARRWFASYPDLKNWAEQGLKLAIFRRTSLEAVRYGEKQAIFIPNPGVTPFMLECTALQEYREVDLETLADEHFDQLEAASKPVDAMPDWISDAVMKVAEPIGKSMAQAMDDSIIDYIKTERRIMDMYGVKFDGFMTPSRPMKDIDWPSFYGAVPVSEKYTPPKTVAMKGVPPGDYRLTRDAYLDTMRIR